MSTVISQTVGIDISSKKFDVCFKEEAQNGKRTIKGTRSFNNDDKGFEQYLRWVDKRKKGTDLIHIMEATGIYYEELCYFLHHKGEKVSVQLPQKVKYFIKSLNLKTKTDRTDAKAIAEMGLSNRLETWEPISKNFKTLKEFTRTLSDIKKKRTAIKSKLHAKRRAHKTSMENIMMLEKEEAFYQELIAECEAKILTELEKDTELKEKVERITIMKGVKAITVIKLLAETDGFRKCSSIRKLVSYAGLDVVQNQSGQFKGRSRISKKGNAHIREALYMPALCAVRYDRNMKSFYERLKPKMAKNKQAVVAAMRKLLVVIYSVWKSGEYYNVDYQWDKNKKGGFYSATG